MISEEEIKNIAKLSYLKINDSELEKMRESFSSILDYVKTLQELDVSNIAETANLSEIHSVFREDNPQKGEREGVIGAFTERSGDYLKVKKILYNED